MSRLRLHGVHKRYGAVAALDDVTLEVPAGSRTAILGPSGSGKSTLLRIVAGFEAPEAGRVRLGEDLLADGPRAVPAHLRGIGLVAQEGALFPHLTIAENIGFGLERDAPGRATRIAELAAMVALEPAMLGRRPDQLSGGQQQRVALARALARRPRLMLLDEPFSALDTGLRASTRKAVSALLAGHGITTILVTHDQVEALSFADQVVVMHGGRLLQAGTPRELYLRPRDAMVAAFLGDAILLPGVAAGGWAECAAGRVAVADPARQGAVRIMLRPEQVSLLPAAAGVPDAAPGGTMPGGTMPGGNTPGGPLSGGAEARVTGVEFGGAACSVSVEVSRGGGAPVPLVLRCSYLTAPSPGAVMRLAVSGEAHLFPGP